MLSTAGIVTGPGPGLGTDPGTGGTAPGVAGATGAGRGARTEAGGTAATPETTGESVYTVNLPSPLYLYRRRRHSSDRSDD